MEERRKRRREKEGEKKKKKRKRRREEKEGEKKKEGMGRKMNESSYCYTQILYVIQVLPLVCNAYNCNCNRNMNTVREYNSFSSLSPSYCKYILIAIKSFNASFVTHPIWFSFQRERERERERETEREGEGEFRT